MDSKGRFRSSPKYSPTIGDLVEKWFVYYPRDWHKWFAWHPVRVNGKRVWLKRVYRRFNYYRSGVDAEYGTIFDVIKEVK